MNLYAWNYYDYVVYTITENPQPGDYIYKDTGEAYEYDEYHYNFVYDWYYSNIIETVQTGATPKIGIRVNENRAHEDLIEFTRNSNGDLEVEGGVEPENLVSKFVHDGVTYTIKDAQAREDIANKQDKLSSTNVLTTGSGNVIDGISASDGIITATKNTTLSTVAISGSYSDLSNKPEDNIIQFITATPSLTPIAGTTYKGTVPLTSLTLTNIPVSNTEIAIYFTTHATDTFTLTATDLVGKWYNVDVPTFQTDSEYVICINNGKAVLGKIGE